MQMRERKAQAVKQTLSVIIIIVVTIVVFGGGLFIVGITPGENPQSSVFIVEDTADNTYYLQIATIDTYGSSSPLNATMETADTVYAETEGDVELSSVNEIGVKQNTLYHNREERQMYPREKFLSSNTNPYTTLVEIEANGDGKIITVVENEHDTVVVREFDVSEDSVPATYTTNSGENRSRIFNKTELDE